MSDGVLVRLAQTDPPVSKNARFTHDMMNFGHDVSEKRFNAHGTRGAPHWSMLVPDENEKTPRKTEVLFLEWEQRESNPRPSACKADALNQLSYAPKRFLNLWLLNQDLNLGPSD